MKPAGLRLTAWIASIAILLAALAPALVKASAPAAPWAEVCTAAGLQSDAQAPAGGDLPGHAGTKHCPWCAGGSHSFVLPSTPSLLPLVSGNATSPADARPTPALRPRLRGASQPRAPPAIS